VSRRDGVVCPSPFVCTDGGRTSVDILVPEQLEGMMQCSVILLQPFQFRMYDIDERLLPRSQR
jgi:hypothetical protein